MSLMHQQPSTNATIATAVNGGGGILLLEGGGASGEQRTTNSRVLAVETTTEVIADADEWHHNQHLHRGTSDTVQSLQGSGVFLIPTTVTMANSGGVGTAGGGGGGVPRIAAPPTNKQAPTPTNPMHLTTFDSIIKGSTDVVPSRYIRVLRHRWDGRLEKHDLMLAFREAITCVNTQANRYHHFWEERLSRMLSITGSTRLGTMRQQLVDAQGDLGDVEKAVKLFALARKRFAELVDELVSHIGEFTDDFSLMMKMVVEEVTNVDWSCMEPPGREHSALAYRLADGFSDIHKQEEAELQLKNSVTEGESTWRKMDSVTKAALQFDEEDGNGEEESDLKYDPHERLLAGGRVAPKTLKLRKQGSMAISDSTGANVLPREAFAAVVIFTHYLPTFFHELLLDKAVDVRPAVVDQHRFSMSELDVWSCEPLNARRQQLQQQKHLDALALLPPPLSPVTGSVADNYVFGDNNNATTTNAVAAADATSSSQKKAAAEVTTSPASVSLSATKKGSVTSLSALKRTSSRPTESAGSSRKALSVKGINDTPAEIPLAAIPLATADPIEASSTLLPAPPSGRAEPLIVTSCTYDNTNINLSMLYVGTESGAVLAIPVHAASAAEPLVTGAHESSANAARRLADHEAKQEKVRAAVSTLIREWKWALEGKMAAKRQRRKKAAVDGVVMAAAAAAQQAAAMESPSMERSSSLLPPKGGSLPAGSAKAAAAAGGSAAKPQQKGGGRRGSSGGLKGVGAGARGGSTSRTMSRSSNPPATEPAAPAQTPCNYDAAFDAKLPPRTLDGVTLFDGHLFPVTHLHYIPSTKILVSSSVGDKSVRFHSTKDKGRLLNIESTAFSGAPSCSVYYGALEAVIVGTYSGHLRMVDPRAGGPPVGTMLLPNHPIHSVTVDPFSSELFVGTRKGHIYGFRLNVDAHHYRPRLEPLNDEGTFSQECMHCFVPDVREALGYKLHEPLVIPGMRSVLTHNGGGMGGGGGGVEGAGRETATTYSNVFTDDGESINGPGSDEDEDGFSSDVEEESYHLQLPIYEKPETIYDSKNTPQLLKGKAGIQERKHPGFHTDLKNRKAFSALKKKKRQAPQSTSPRSIREAVTAGRHLIVTGGHTVAVTTMVAISGFLFSGDAIGRIYQWDLLTHELVRKYHGHSDDITSITVTADGFLFATSKDALITVWNAVDGNILTTINRHYGGVPCIALGYLGGQHMPNPFGIVGGEDDKKGGAGSSKNGVAAGGPSGSLRQVLEHTRQRGDPSANYNSNGGGADINIPGEGSSPVKLHADHNNAFIPFERPLNAVEALAAANFNHAAAQHSGFGGGGTAPTMVTANGGSSLSLSSLVCSRENIKIGSPSPPLLVSVSSDQSVISWMLKYKD